MHCSQVKASKIKSSQVVCNQQQQIEKRLNDRRALKIK